MQRHIGEDKTILSNRTVVYIQAKERCPERWSKDIRNWAHISEVHLNPGKCRLQKKEKRRYKNQPISEILLENYRM
jgi:hypothetical protein